MAADVKIANTSDGLLSTFGSFSGQVFTTSDASGLAGVTVTAAAGLTIGEQTVNVTTYSNCLKLVTAAASTSYQVTLSAPEGYVITGYTLGGSANTSNAVHTLTSADGAVSVVASAPPYNNPTGPKEFSVTGLNSQSTYFTISTANSGNTLYIPTFTITVQEASSVVDVTYNIVYDGSVITTADAAGSEIGAAPSLPVSAQKDFCTYAYFSDEACESSLSELTSSTTTVYALCTFAPPFTVSSSYANATWYYLKLKNANYPTYVSSGTPNVTLPSISIWYFNGTNLINYGNGGYAAVNNSNFLGVATAADATPATMAFVKNGMGELGAFNVQLFGNTRYLYANKGLYTDAGGSNNSYGYNFNVEEVTSLPVTISAAKYATLYAPVALTIPSGVTVYAVTDGTDKVTMTAIDGSVIPAETGVILYADVTEATTYDFAITTTEATITSDLTGVLATAARPEGSYILSGGTHGVGFYKDGPETVAGFKAYLPASNGGSVKAFWFGTPTAIEMTGDGSKGMETVYDLSGRRVSKPVRGLYIVNGKKAVVK